MRRRRTPLALAGTLVALGAVSSGCSEDEPASCGGIAVADVGRAVGVDSLGLEDVPGDGGCAFVDSDARERPQVLVQERSRGRAELEELRVSTEALHTVPAEDLDLADGAWLLVGTSKVGGATDVSAEAAVLEDGTLTSVLLVQREGMSAEEVRERALAVLDLVVAAS